MYMEQKEGEHKLWSLRQPAKGADILLVALE